MEQKIQQLDTPAQQPAFVAFDPFSAIVIEKLNERRDLKNKLRLFEDILNDGRAEVIFEIERAKTIAFPNHKGSQHKTWTGIKQMAKDINASGESVAFLPELNGETSADAIVLFNGKPVVADFKYCVTKKDNTLAGELEDGFKQARTVVVKLENMDSGVFNDAIDYLVRNDIPFGNIKLLNEYGKILEFTEKDLRYGAYKKKIKGFL